MKAVKSNSSKPPFTEVIEIEKPTCPPNRLLIKTVSLAANPTDWKHMVRGVYGLAGSDASGIVEEVGSDVKGFEVGDIVSSNDHGNTDMVRGRFAEYILGNPDSTFKYDKLTFETDKKLPLGRNDSSYLTNFDAIAGVTLGICTVGNSFTYHLNIPADKEANKDKYILLWGGATATGIYAIQIAKLIYGLKVITTCSAKNFDFVKSFGADYIFDYNSETVIEDIKKQADGKLAYVLDCVSMPETYKSCYDCTEGSETIAIDNLLGMGPDKIGADKSRNIHWGSTLVYHILGEDVVLMGVDRPSNPELVKAYQHFRYELLPPVLSKIRCNNILMLEPGLETANKALELSFENKVSAEKLVWRVN